MIVLKVFLGSLTILILFLILIYIIYWIKVRLNISWRILPEHTPCYLQRWSKGIIKCKWFPKADHCKYCKD